MNRRLLRTIHVLRFLTTGAPLVCLVCSAFMAAAQQLPTAKPESIGLSSERLERIGAAVQRSIDEKRIAGAVTLWHAVAVSPGSRRRA